MQEATGVRLYNFLTSKFQISEQFDPAVCSLLVYSLLAGKADPWRWQYQGPVNKSIYFLFLMGYKMLCRYNKEVQL